MLYSSDTAVTVESLRDTYRVPTVDELKAIRGDAPGMGNRWQPTHHADLVTSIEEAATERGLTVAERRFQLSEDRHDIFGTFRFETPGYFDRQDMAPVLGFRNSNVQRFRLLGVTGARVFVCSNGMISGDFVFGHKNTTGNARDSEVKIEVGLAKWEAQAKRLHRMVEHMETVELADRDADHFLVEAVRRRIFSASQLGRVDALYRDFAQEDNQYHEAFAPRNAWSLYSAVTEAAKGSTRAWSPTRVEATLKEFPRMVAALTGFEGMETPAELAVN